MLTHHFPEVRTLATPAANEGELIGCAVARSLGASKAKAPLVCFIDDDNVIAPNMLETLATALEEDPSLGAVGPLMYKWPDGNGIWCAGALLTKHHLVSYLSSEELFETADDRGLLVPCDFIPNVFCTKSETLLKVPFDIQSFPHNGTELDWALRLKAAKYEVRISILTKTWHDYEYTGMTTRTTVPALVHDQARARVRLRTRHRRTFGSLVSFWILWLPATWTYMTYRFVREHQFVRMNRAFMRGTFDGMRS